MSKSRAGLKRRTVVWTADLLRSAFVYDAETGLFTWRIDRKHFKIGDKVGSIKPTGYVELGYMNSTILAHRAAWLYVHGEHPAGPVDHINGVKNDNRMANLRVVEHCENVWNAPRQFKSVGTYRQYKGDRFYAHIRHRGQRIHLGTFDTRELAAAAYQAAAERLRGEFHAPASKVTRPDEQDAPSSSIGLGAEGEQ